MSNMKQSKYEKLRLRTSGLKQELISAADISAAISSNYLVKNWLEPEALSMIYGASNTGKTFLALHLASCIATEADWFGERVLKGAVLYIAAEGGAGVKNRVCALRDEVDGFAQSPFFLLPTSLNLQDDIDLHALLAVAKDVKPALIVIDTLARVMGHGDENSAAEASKFIRACDFLRCGTGAHVMLVHHSGKDSDKGARGSSAFRAAVDTEIEVTTRGEIVCRKQRNMTVGPTKYFQLASHCIGEDEDGDCVTVALVVETDQKRPAPKKLRGSAQVALFALEAALEQHGSEFRNHPNVPPNTKVADLTSWKDECLRRGITKSDKPDSQRRAFERAMEQLIEKDRVRVYDEYVWKVFDDEGQSNDEQ